MVGRRPDPPEEETDPSEKFKPGPERAIDINIGDGATLHLTSNTIPPQMLREVRVNLERMCANAGR